MSGERIATRPLPAGALGAGWRPALAWAIEQRARRGELDFVELVCESVPPGTPPRAVAALRDRGIPVVVHGTGLSLGSAEPPEDERLERLRALADACGSPLVSEHIAFVRSHEHETGHLLPVPRTRAMLDVLADNVRRAQDALAVPLALENGASLFRWPEDELSWGDFHAELLDRTGAPLLLDLANLWADAVNERFDPDAALASLPHGRIAYVHVAGGAWRRGFFADTHAHAVHEDVLALLQRAQRQVGDVPVLLERDDRFPAAAEWNAELDAIAAVCRGAERGDARRRERSREASVAAEGVR